MSSEKMILGLIPARAGSKGVPNKNIRMVNGKPLIAYAIECGLTCPLIDQLIVSTDGPEIAKIAKDFGASVPFMRPAELAEDTSPMLPVMQHAVLMAEKKYGKRVEFLILLDPTGPLRIEDDLTACISMLNEQDCDAVVSANKAHRSPYFNMVKINEGYVDLFSSLEGGDISRRQDSPEVYDLNTVVWGYKRPALMEENERIPKKTKLLLVPPERAIDIDTEHDLFILETLLSSRDYTSGVSRKL